MKWREVLNGSERVHYFEMVVFLFNALNAELNAICHLLALLGGHHILHVSRINVNSVIYIFLLLYICCILFNCVVLCVNVYLQVPPGLNPIAVNKIYQCRPAAPPVH